MPPIGLTVDQPAPKAKFDFHLGAWAQCSNQFLVRIPIQSKMTALWKSPYGYFGRQCEVIWHVGLSGANGYRNNAGGWTSAKQSIAIQQLELSDGGNRIMAGPLFDSLRRQPIDRHDPSGLKWQRFHIWFMSRPGSLLTMRNLSACASKRFVANLCGFWPRSIAASDLLVRKMIDGPLSRGLKRGLRMRIRAKGLNHVHD